MLSIQTSDKCSIPSSTSGTNQCVYPAGHSPPHRHAVTIPRKPRAADGCAPRLRVPRDRCNRYVPDAARFAARPVKRSYPRPETCKGFVVRKIKWQRELCRCVQRYLNQISQNREKFTTESHDSLNRAATLPGRYIICLLYPRLLRPAPLLQGAAYQSV